MKKPLFVVLTALLMLTLSAWHAPAPAGDTGVFSLSQLLDIASCKTKGAWKRKVADLGFRPEKEEKNDLGGITCTYTRRAVENKYSIALYVYFIESGGGNYSWGFQKPAGSNPSLLEDLEKAALASGFAKNGLHGESEEGRYFTLRSNDYKMTLYEVKGTGTTSITQHTIMLEPR